MVVAREEGGIMVVARMKKKGMVVVVAVIFCVVLVVVIAMWVRVAVMVVGGVWIAVGMEVEFVVMVTVSDEGTVVVVDRMVKIVRKMVVKLEGEGMKRMKMVEIREARTWACIVFHREFLYVFSNAFFFFYTE